MKNFTSGALVMMIWRFDGSSELIAKFQYMRDAQMFCEAKLADDENRGANKEGGWFYLAVCESDCEARAYSKAAEKSNA
ncbi:hypothetical protein LPB79_13040 [Rhizobium sp. T136]|uniref:Uncharacterized protein n=1 Tax=Rhizobium favelukesii TaxID=348824 RepID=W6R9P3_9HYPH|nr:MULTISPECIES: hypothetical protein [Rhizobium]UFS83172.1 hypothetical protein LPB79_13040 [Rhizobium sp. T136]CDM57644.1 putative predicted protein [Rhizobium favelukesii]